MKTSVTHRGREKERLPVWALVVIDVLATCFALGLFMLFHLVLPRIQDQKTAEAEAFYTTSISTAPSPEPAAETSELSEQPQTPEDDWKFANLTTDDVVISDTGYSSHDIHIDILSYDEGEGIISSPYTVADIYVRDVRCLQSYFAGGKYIPTGHGEPMLSLMEKSGAIVASNGDYYSMQLGSGVLRNGVLYRYPVADFDVFVLYDDGSVKTIRRKTIKTQVGWEEAFDHAWQAWSFGPSLLDENGVPYQNLRDNLFGFVVNRNPRTGIGYFEPGHYCLVVIDGRSDEAPGATIEELAAVFEDLGCVQAYNLDGGGSSVMAFNGEIITNQSADRKLPDIILVTEYEGSPAEQDLKLGSEG